MTRMPALAAATLIAFQGVGASITGVVRDGATGDPIVGAEVVLPDLGRTAVTGLDGVYAFGDVPPGPQHLRVHVLGYTGPALHLLVPASGVLRVDLTLSAAPIEVAAVVAHARVPVPGSEADPPALDSPRAVSSAAARHDPFTAEPDLLESLMGGPVSRSPEGPGGLHVEGGAADQVGYLLDGIPVFQPFHTGARSSAWNPDAVAAAELHGDPTLAADALTGTVLVRTVEPGERLGVRGTASTSHAGLTLDGPLPGGAGFVAGGRAGWPGMPGAPDEDSYLRGNDHDVILKLGTPAGGGRLDLIGFDHGNSIRTASVSTEDRETGPGPAEGAEPNRFDWGGRSLGAEWRSATGPGRSWTLRAWRATGHSRVRWQGVDPAHRLLESEREQYGVLAAVDLDGRPGGLELGVRAERDRLEYAVGPAGSGTAAWRVGQTGTAAGGFARLRHDLGRGFEVRSEVLAGVDDQGARLWPRLRLGWRAGDRLELHAEAARTGQLLQSLRNPESVVGRIFPAEPPAGGSGTEIPRARSRRGAVGLTAVPGPGVRVAAQAYARSVEGLALVAPAEDGPFADGVPAAGSGSVAGASVEVSASGARYGLVASAGWERVRLRVAGESYAPGYAASRRARLGGVWYVTPSLSVRGGWVGEAGRTGTDVLGAFEWESCNVEDRGCEFAGTPEGLGPRGGTGLPAYHRLDLSLRKHWHLRRRGRDLRLEVFATGTNLLGRSNVLGYTVHPETGARAPIELRVRAPLALGLGWSF